MVLVAIIMIVLAFIYMLWDVNKCQHDYKFIRHTYGDENNISLSLGGRNIYKCSKCKKVKYSNE